MNLDDYVLLSISRSGEIVHSPADHATVSNEDIEYKCQLYQSGIYWFAKCLQCAKPKLRWSV